MLRAALRFDRRLIDQHDGYVVLHRIDPVTFRTLQAFGALPVFEHLLARWTDQNFQKIFGNHDFGLYDMGNCPECDYTHIRA